MPGAPDPRLTIDSALQSPRVSTCLGEARRAQAKTARGGWGQRNRWRYYDPSLGRYLQSDPLGYAGSPVNLYAYAPNPLVQVDLFGLECEGDKDGGAPKGKKNDGQEDTPAKKPLEDMDDDEVKAHCKARADELNQQLKDKDAASNKARRDAYDADPRPVSEKGPPPKDTNFAEGGTTLCVGVVEKDGKRKTVVTSSKDRGPCPVELGPGEEYRPTGNNAKERAQDPASQPELVPGGRLTGGEVEAKDRNGNTKTDANGDPIMKPERVEGSRKIIRDEQGNKIGEEPYDKASTSELRNNPDAEGSTEHHAEQRMVNGTRDDEKLVGMAPSKECCQGCCQFAGSWGQRRVTFSRSWGHPIFRTMGTPARGAQVFRVMGPAPGGFCSLMGPVTG